MSTVKKKIEDLMITSKKDYISFFKELYNRKPSEEELKVFIECMQ